MAITPAHEAIAILIDLAERGEIDPWNVRVIEVIDRFLAELGLIGEVEAVEPDADLPQSGQAFLWASMLVLLKANTLELLQEQKELQEQEEFIEENFLESEDNRQSSLPLNLERHLRRRTSVPPVYKRRVTLQELIEQLEHIAVELEVAPSKPRPRHSHGSRRDTIRAITQLAHNENLTELAAQLERFLHFDLPELSPEQEWIDWEQLLHWWHNNNRHRSNEETISNERHSSSDRAGVFWALLLLSAQSKVELSQQEFYQDLSVRSLNCESKYRCLGA
ncbi:segregation/condensation protein A [Pleurocapsales cyanobacterium LEGE 06147]|nr:segregation/condensation protein A [Pleurocapsales cyanobacterium LEGE 06147]